ncbi:DUF89 family protein [bacterium]|nr:DUF89 family protein [bacterium]
MDKRCEKCVLKFTNKVETLFNLVENDDYITEMKSLEKEIGNFKYAADFHRNANNIFIKYLGEKDYFRSQKKALNKKVMGVFNEVEDRINNSKDSFLSGMKYSIGGNKFDLAQGKDIEKIVIDFMNINIDDEKVNELREKLSISKNVLIIGDNAGEIVLDMLLVKEIKKLNEKIDIDYFVRSHPILNDSTMDDLNDYFYSFPVNFKPFLYEKKDDLNKLNEYEIIILKGQANLETYYPFRDERFYFLFVVKCEVVAEIVNKEEGAFVILGDENGL